MKKFTILLSSILFTLSVSLADNHSDKLPVEADYYPITTIPLPTPNMSGDYPRQ